MIGIGAKKEILGISYSVENTVLCFMTSQKSSIRQFIDAEVPSFNIYNEIIRLLESHGFDHTVRGSGKLFFDKTGIPFSNVQRYDSASLSKTKRSPTFISLLKISKAYQFTRDEFVGLISISSKNRLNDDEMELLKLFNFYTIEQLELYLEKKDGPN